MRTTLLTVIFAFLTACGSEPAANNQAVQAPANNSTAFDHSNMNHADTDRSNNSHTMSSSPGAASAPYELQFIDSMTAHHQAAVEIAILAESRAAHPEIKELAANIIADQEREVATMSKWREQWFVEAPKAINMDFPGMSEGMRGMDMKKLASLKDSEFDLEFIRQMIPHHEGAVRMARDSVAKSQKAASSNSAKTTEKSPPIDPEKKAELAEMFRAFAEEIIEVQSVEIDQMKKLQAAWRKGN